MADRFIHPAKVVTKDEALGIIKELKRRSKRSVGAWRRLVIFRLATMCGLRRMEIAHLNIGDVCPGENPVLSLRPGCTKGGRPRLVPYDWHRESQADIEHWLRYVVQNLSGGRRNAPLVPRVESHSYGQRTSARAVGDVLGRLLRTHLGEERRRMVSGHSCRHAFITYAAAKNVPLQVIRDAVGHRNISTTNIYTHTADLMTKTKYRIFEEDEVDTA